MKRYLFFFGIIFLLFNISISTIFATENSDTLSKNGIESVFDKNTHFPLSNYNPLYFVDGYPNAKVLLSFKYEFHPDWNLYFAYNQMMFWDFHELSKPFRDINYNPMFFYRLNAKWWIFDAVHFGFYEHKSNGRGGEESRSYDDQFVQFISSSNWNGFILTWKLKLYVLHSFDDTNDDIRDYMGFWETEFYVGLPIGKTLEGIGLYLKVISGGKYGTKPWKGGQEAILAFRWNIYGVKPILALQFYHGYGESLLDYNKSDISYRIGFMLFI